MADVLRERSASRIASIAWVSKRRRWASGCTANYSQPGFPIIVVEARHMGVSLSTMRNKTDRNDARGIAQMMRLGRYRAVHVKNIDMQKMRRLLVNRKLLKRKLIDIENHIRVALSLDVPTKPAFVSCSNVAIRVSR